QTHALNAHAGDLAAKREGVVAGSGLAVRDNQQDAIGVPADALEMSGSEGDAGEQRLAGLRADLVQSVLQELVIGGKVLFEVQLVAEHQYAGLVVGAEVPHDLLQG